MILFPPAKVNIGLRVLGKRPDGYHEIESYMVPVGLYDALELIPSDEFEFKYSGLSMEGHSDDNLCVRAYRLLEREYGIGPVYMHLLKTIPMGAGLGGGSSDAAYVIKGLNELFVLDLSSERMQELSAQLGSDCPFFIETCGQMAKGRGEQLSMHPYEWGQYWIQLINPGIHVSTAEAYAGVQFSGNDVSLEACLMQPVETWKYTIHNDFEHSVFARHPSLKQIKEQLYREGALYASMSGSGSTIFGIYDQKPKATHSDYFGWMGKIIG